MGEGNDIPLQCKNRLERISKGQAAQEIDTTCLQGLQVVTSQKGLIVCTFVVPSALSDKDRNWHPGAIAILVDDLAALVASSLDGARMLSVNFSISFLSTVRIQEEVEIEAKVLSNDGKLFPVVVEVRRKCNGDVVALGKEWMSTSKVKLPNSSKL